MIASRVLVPVPKSTRPRTLLMCTMFTLHAQSYPYTIMSATKTFLASVITSSILASFSSFDKSAFQNFYTVFSNTTLVDFVQMVTPYVRDGYDQAYLSALTFCLSAFVAGIYVARCFKHPIVYRIQSLANGLTSNIETEIQKPLSSLNQLLVDLPNSEQITNADATQASDVVTQLTNIKHENFHPIYSISMYAGKFTFATTNAINDVIASISFPALATHPNIRRLFNDYRMASFDIRFTVNITGSPMATGQLLGAVRPAYPSVPTSFLASVPTPYSPATPLVALTALAHTIIDVSIDGIYTFDLPFYHFNTYFSNLDYTTSPSYGSLNILALTPFSPAIGAPTSVTLEVYASLMNIKTHEVAPYLAQSLISIGEHNSITYKLSDIQNASLPSNVSGDTLSATVPNPFGLDNPSDTRNPPSFVSSIYQKILSSMNVLSTFRFSANPSKIVTMDRPVMDDLRLDVDEMSLDFFRNRWLYNFSFNFNTTTPNNNLIASIPIVPLSNYNFTAPNRESSFQDLAVFQAYWRGSMRYRIAIASNIYKRAKLLIAIHYNYTLASIGNITTGAVDPRSCPHLIVDISNTDRYVDVEVPWKSINEFKRIAANSSNTIDNPENSLGVLGVYLVSPLQVTNGVSNIVYCSMFSAWGSDMNFYTQDTTPSYYSQSSLVVSPTTTSQTRLNRMAEIISLKELMLRPIYLGCFQFIPQGATNPAMPIVVPVHPTLWAGVSEWSYLLNMYSGMCGSVRLIIRYASGTSPARITFYPYINEAGQPNAREQFSDGEISSNNGSVALCYPYTDYAVLRQVANRTTHPVLNNSFLTVLTSHQDVILHSVTQPEVIVEIPDSSPIYRTSPTYPVPTNYNFNQATYSPLKDRNVPIVVIQPLDQFQGGPSGTGAPVPIPTSIHISAVVGDDFRMFWFNGGPSQATDGQYNLGGVVQPDVRTNY